jgi:protein phosphatase 2C family protein 2/3
MDYDHRFRPNSGLGGRIILLGDGTEITSESADSEMFDHDDEDKDYEEHQAPKAKVNENDAVPIAGSGETGAATLSVRETTPGPKSTNTSTISPSSTHTEKSETVEEPKTISATDSCLPDKFVEGGVSEK